MTEYRPVTELCQSELNRHHLPTKRRQTRADLVLPEDRASTPCVFGDILRIDRALCYRTSVEGVRHMEPRYCEGGNR
jgi:hypothetical protein